MYKSMEHCCSDIGPAEAFSFEPFLHKRVPTHCILQTQILIQGTILKSMQFLLVHVFLAQNILITIDEAHSIFCLKKNL